MRGFRVWSDFWKRYSFDAELYTDGSLYAMFEDDDGVTHHENTDLVLEFKTGLKDKNGKEIYEGDVVRWVDDYDENAYINFDEGCFWVNWSINSERINGDMVDDLEVIGNIHENQDLLGDTNVTNKGEEE